MNRLNPSSKKSTSSTNIYCINHGSSDDNGSWNVMGFTCLSPITKRKQPDRNWVTENVYPYLLFISSIFLITTFVVYSVVPEIRNIHGICVMCHVISMAVTYIGLGIVEMNLDLSKGLCITLANVTHYASLSAFAWLSVMSFDIWRGFSHLRPSARCPDGKMHQKRRFLFYSIYAWTVPFIITLTGFITDRIDEKNVKKCWFENEEERQNDRRMVRPHFGEGGRCWFPYTGHELAPNVAYLYAPVGFLLLMNIVFFIMTTIAFYRINLDTALATSGKDRARQKFRAIFSIFILMGVSWTSKLISDVVVREESVTWMVTDIFNILTNGLVFFIVVICKPTVWNHLRLKYLFNCLELLQSRVKR